MAVILAESVAITKSRLTKGFNNLNGKVISAQEADNGFKAAGSVNPPYIAVIASGNQKGFAAGAVAAFNDYVKDINFNKYNAENVINKYFDDMQSVVENCGIDGGRLSVGVVCAYDDCVIAAKSTFVLMVFANHSPLKSSEIEIDSSVIAICPKTPATSTPR